MPKSKHMKKVLVIGSGPIVIGQAAEFDYAGTQACLTLKAEGCEVILLNNNPATIMTDEQIADKVYFEPLTIKNVEKIIQAEHPDGILATVSGQTGLNLAFQLEEAHILQQYDVKVLGTSTESIMKGEDREKFRSLMQEINEPIPESAIIETIDEAVNFLDEVALPIIIRPAYTLGGSGGGIATTKAEFMKYVTSGLQASPIHQCLIEKSIAGWKEIEFEVICDASGTAAVVCHMENFDPVGVHTGDSIVVAPIQTLSGTEIKLLQDASLHIVKNIGIVGACNVQLGFNPDTKEYIVIEVNPRVSRSSALASKATGYPIAKIATKLSLGYTLSEIYHAQAGKTLDQFEPTFDYTIVKFPSFPFDKLTTADRKLGTQMKATGEVMAIEKTIAAGMQKAVRSLELEVDGLSLTSIQSMSTSQLKQLIVEPDDRRFFAILEAMRRGVTARELWELSKIDLFFLSEMKKLVDLEKTATLMDLDIVSNSTLLALKQAGFTNTWLASEWNCSQSDITAKLTAAHIAPAYQKIDGFTEMHGVNAAYYYAVWQQGKKQTISSTKNKVLIIGSGPIRIGQGVEFDYCSVQGIMALQKAQYETILINNNPATVSTDYEFADKLYFEPITVEDVLHVIKQEQVEQVIVQFGGQTAINLVKELENAGITLLGSSMDTIDMLEDRDRFYQYVKEVGVAHIPGLTAATKVDLYEKAEEIGYPVLVRPSYVIGGKGMAIMEKRADVTAYIAENVTETSYPFLVDAYYPGKEVEVDVITDGKHILIPAIFEHLEKAGVHSGDSMAVTPPITLRDEEKQQIVAYTEQIATGMEFKGIFNIQFVIHEEVLYVLEVNPRASRTVPVVSKVTGVNMIELATDALLGKHLVNANGPLLPENDFYTVKAPVFSTVKLPGVDPKLVPEMKSTGEVIAIAETFAGSVTKAFLWNEKLASQFAQQAKEISVPSVDPEMEDRLHQLHVKVKDQPDDTWLKSKDAFAIFSTETKDSIRKRAVECDVLVLSAQETLQAFSQMTTDELGVRAIQSRQPAYEKIKDVVLQ